MAVYASGTNPSLGPITCLSDQGPTGVASSGAELARCPLESLPPFHRTASPAHTSSTGCTLPGTPWAVLTTPQTGRLPLSPIVRSHLIRPKASEGAVSVSPNTAAPVGLLVERFRQYGLKFGPATA